MNAVCLPFKTIKAARFGLLFVVLKCRVCEIFRTFRFSRFLHVSFFKSSTFRFAGFTFKVDSLLFPQEYYVKGHEEYKEKCSINLSNVDYGDALNEIGDYYWYNNINRLNINHQKEYEFFRNFAIVQYCAYTSVSFKDFPRGVVLPSQELTKKLIRYLAYEREDVVFVIMRSAAKWKELLDADVWEKMQSRLIVNKNMSQSLSENNLGKKNFNMLIEYLK